MPTDPDDFLPEFVAGAVGTVPGGSLFAVGADRLTRAIRDEWRRNTSRTLRLACEHAGLSREELAERLDSEPQLVPLFVRVLHAAGMNGHDKTLRILAGFLGEALADHSKIDDVALLLASVSDFTSHHIKVLEIVAAPLSEAVRVRETKATHWTTAVLADFAPMRGELALAAAQGLLKAGFLSDGGGPTYGDMEEGGTILTITELGRTVLEVLHAVSERADA